MRKLTFELRSPIHQQNAIQAIQQILPDPTKPIVVTIQERNRSLDQNRSYEQGSVERALTCANCGQKLHVLEVHVCEHCCAELMSDPNSSMYEEEDDE